MGHVGISMLWALATAAIGAALPGQDLPEQTAPPSGQEPVLVDTVVATVNDAAIMLSTIRTEVAGKIRAAQARMGRRLTSAEIITVFRAQLDDEVDKHALAQSAKSFGIATPEQVEQLLVDEMKRDEDAQVRDLGTWQEFSRELQRQGRTWQTYYREQRVEKMFLFAKEFAIGMRLQKQQNLFLTPKMLRETYRRETARFVRGAEAQLAVIQFRGPNAKQHAAAASTIWALEALDPELLLARVPGATASPLGVMLVTEASRESLAAELVDFALAGPADRVSAPLTIGTSVMVGRILAHRPPRNGKFEDPDVQLELREICLESVIGEFTKQALDRAADRTEVWKSQVFR